MQTSPLAPALIGRIYDTAIDGDKWPDISKVVGKASGIEHMGVWILDHGEIADISLAEIWRPLGATYKQRFSRLDPWAASLARAPLETVMLGYEHLREDELVRTEFYNEFARAGGMFRPMGVRIQLGPRVFANIGSDLPWSKLRLRRADKPRLQRLIPYVKRALQLRRRLGDRGIRTGVHAAALDNFSFGVIVCDGAGRIVVINKAAEALARAGAGLTLGRAGRGLGAIMPAQARALAALVNDAASGGPGGILQLSGREGCTELIALVTPLPRSFGLGAGISPAHALVTLRSPRDSPSFSAETLIALFHVSPAQAEIALAIYNGKPPEQIAGERGVAISTLRTHLAEIFLRTGTENQRDLVRLLGMLPPVRQRFLER